MQQLNSGTDVKMREHFCYKYFSLFALLFMFEFNLYSQPMNSDIFIGNVILPYDIRKGVTSDPDSFVHVFSVSLAPDGYISTIALKTSDSLLNPIVIEIKHDENVFSITKSDPHATINTITIISKNELSVNGPVLSYVKNKPQTIKVASSPGILYEGEGVILRHAGGDLTETIQADNPRLFACRYSNSVLFVDYRTSGNIDRKIEYSAEHGIVYATYYVAAGRGEYDKYAPPIKVVGAGFHNTDIMVNVVNYFIIKAIDQTLSEILFPLFFLPSFV